MFITDRELITTIQSIVDLPRDNEEESDNKLLGDCWFTGVVQRVFTVQHGGCLPKR